MIVNSFHVTVVNVLGMLISASEFEESTLFCKYEMIVGDGHWSKIEVYHICAVGM